MKLKSILIALLALLVFQGCTYVEPGHVGLLVNMHGSDKNAEPELVHGKVWVGVNEKLYIFPTFQQTYKWTKATTEGSSTDESMDFQTADQMSINLDLGVQYTLEESKIPALFQKYRKGVEELTDATIHDMVRDQLNKLGPRDSLNHLITGDGKARLLDSVRNRVAAELAPYGVKDLQFRMLGKWRYPTSVEAAINSKLEATQKAEQAENELQRTRAEAAKSVAEAEGAAKAIVVEAKAQAEANELKQRTITKELISMAWIEKWNGELPQVTSSSSTPMVDLRP